MAYTAKSYDHLLGTPGFSDALLKNHFTLDQGYVTNTNKVNDELAALLADGKQGTPAFAELKRRLGWEWNGMRLHEYYFANMKNGGAALDAPFCHVFRFDAGKIVSFQQFTDTGHWSQLMA